MYPLSAIIFQWVAEDGFDSVVLGLAKPHNMFAATVAEVWSVIVGVTPNLHEDEELQEEDDVVVVKGGEELVGVPTGVVCLVKKARYCGTLC